VLYDVKNTWDLNSPVSGTICGPAGDEVRQVCQLSTEVHKTINEVSQFKTGVKSTDT
jgi:hypothetical protein